MKALGPDGGDEFTRGDIRDLPHTAAPDATEILKVGPQFLGGLTGAGSLRHDADEHVFQPRPRQLDAGRRDRHRNPLHRRCRIGPGDEMDFVTPVDPIDPLHLGEAIAARLGSAADRADRTGSSVGSYCRRIAVTSSSSTLRPRWIITTCWQISSACGITWVENRIVAPRRCSARIRSRSCRVLTGSNPLNGSSRIRRSGWCRIAATNLHLLQHPLRQFFAPLPFGAGKTDAFERALNPLGQIGAVQTLQTTHERQERAHPHLSIHAALFRQVADPILCLQRRPVSEHRQLAGIREEDRHDHPDGGGLAGAVGADETVECAARDDQVQIADRRRRPERLADPLQENGSVH